MRTREQIEADDEKIVYSILPDEAKTGIYTTLILEVLLDIRELLMNPPVEISGTPVLENDSVEEGTPCRHAMNGTLGKCQSCTSTYQ